MPAMRKYLPRPPRRVSDTRFTLAGIGAVFAGFTVLAAFGGQFGTAAVEAEEFGDCHAYGEGMHPRPVPCEDVERARIAFFALVVGLVAAGVLALVRGMRGDWDQRVKPGDMLGPGRGGGAGEAGTGGGSEPGGGSR